MRLKRQALITAFTLAMLTACQKQSPDTPNTDVPGERPNSSVEAPAAPRPTYDGPFGLRMGLSPEEAKVVMPSLEEAEQGSGIYRSDSVPTPHPDFKSYLLFFSSKSGLCKIVAIGKDIQSGYTGLELRTAFDDLDKALSEKYGKGKKYDVSA